MGTVGISFGSATSGQGFDVATTVTQIQAAEQAIETPWTTQLTALKAQDTAFTSIGTDLSTLTTSLQSLTDFTGALAQKQGASSDTNLVALTAAATTASAGSHTVVVNKLALTSSNYSDTVTTAADTLSGSITIQVGSSGTPQTVTVGTSSNTLSTLAAAINLAGVGVSASIISDSSGSRLSLVSSTGGAAGQLTVTSNLTNASTSAAIAFHTGSLGQDASLSVDGIALTSSSNTVTNAIPGVTFQLLAADANTTVQVQVTNDNSAVGTAMSAFVTAYNAVIKDINTQEGKDSSGNAEPLLGSPILSSIQSGLTSGLFAGSKSGTISSITQLGLTVGTDGTLSLNTDTLQSALTSSYADVTGFLQNTGSFGQSFATTLNSLGTQSLSGTVYLALQQNSTIETNLNQNVTNEDALLAAQKTTLTTELNTANQVLQSIPSQLNQVNEIYSAITGYNNSTNG